MVRHHLKTPPLKKLLQFQDRICFFIKNTHKKNTLKQVTGGKIANIVLKKMLELFLKISTLKKILEFEEQRETAKLIQEKKLQTTN